MVYIGAVQAQNEDLEFEIDSNGVITSSRYLEAVEELGKEEIKRLLS